MKTLAGNLERSMPDLCQVVTGKQAIVLAQRQAPIILSNDKSVVLVGDIFPRRDGEISSIVRPLSAEDAIRAAKAVTQNLWGRYAMICASSSTGLAAWMRDPSGAQRLYAWHCDPLTVVTDAFPMALMKCLDGPPAIHWHRLSQLLVQTELSASFSALHQVDIAVPGTLEVIQAQGLERMAIWSPSHYARPTKQAQPQDLPAIAAQCINLWLCDHDKVTLELSGGLDSSIVAGLLAGSQQQPFIQALNIAPDSPGGDERRYAKAVAEKWSFGLIETRVAPAELDYSGLLQMPRTPEPAVYGLDLVADGLSAQMADAFQATRIFSGQGGDAVFFQPHSPLIAADYLRRHGPNSTFFGLVNSSAAANNTSIWQVLDTIWKATPSLDRRSIPIDLAGPISRLAWQDDPLVHPWISDGLHLPAGKRMQIAMLTNCLLFHRATRTSEGRRLIHPLLSQPLVEACLAIPLWQLVPDRRERGLARDVFGHLLPQDVRDRRGKGEASGFYNRVIVTHLTSLRPLLLDGVLASKGLISPDAVATMLTAEHLLWKDDHPIIGSLIALELWARSWS
ncbi:asparagine synthase C-terminal domain-containing protein [Blastomonas sp. AAP53]|uniref:asparagine synthase-related protein n=1 Tax=Blastomonas sp. AAP53 TaxID=1248760 RepID=UPI00037A7098|nr:asparagine synthase C-terminal domain-containing protein [Blastomonas sp. AAP53]